MFFFLLSFFQNRGGKSATTATDVDPDPWEEMIAEMSRENYRKAVELSRKVDEFGEGVDKLREDVRKHGKYVDEQIQKEEELAVQVYAMERDVARVEKTIAEADIAVTLMALVAIERANDSPSSAPSDDGVRRSIDRSSTSRDRRSKRGRALDGSCGSSFDLQ